MEAQRQRRRAQQVSRKTLIRNVQTSLIAFNAIEPDRQSLLLELFAQLVWRIEYDHARATTGESEPRRRQADERAAQTIAERETRAIYGRIHRLKDSAVLHPLRRPRR